MKNFSTILSTIAVVLASIAMYSVYNNKVNVSAADVEAAVKSNPKMIVEAWQAYEEEQQAAKIRARDEAMARYADEINNEEGVPFVGPKDAKITLVEFFDFSCGFCKRLAPNIEKIISDNTDVKVVFKPVSFVSRVSSYQAKAGIAAHKQGKFLEFYKAIMASQNASSEAAIDDIAASVNLDMDQYKKDLQSEETTKALDRVETLRANIEVNGVPALFLNAKSLHAASVAEIQEAINAAK